MTQVFQKNLTTQANEETGVQSDLQLPNEFENSAFSAYQPKF